MIFIRELTEETNFPQTEAQFHTITMLSCFYSQPLKLCFVAKLTL